MIGLRVIAVRDINTKDRNPFKKGEIGVVSAYTPNGVFKFRVKSLDGERETVAEVFGLGRKFHDPENMCYHFVLESEQETVKILYGDKL